MKSLITTGHESSGIEAIWTLMRAYDVAEAAPALSEIDDPAKFHQKLYSARKVGDANAPGQINPGRMWQSQAENLLINNVESEIWGWADVRSSRLLEFWAGVDQSTHFVLLYVAPEVAFAMAPEINLDTASEPIDVLAYWRQKNGELLDFYSRNRKRCLLINTYSLIAQPNRLNELLADRFGIETLNTVRACSLSYEYPVSAIRTHLARNLLQDAEAAALYEELETASDLPALDDYDQYETVRAWVEHSKLINQETQLGEILASINFKQQALVESEAKLAHANGQLKEANLQFQSSKQANSKLSEQISELKLAQAKSQQNNEELRKENELLLLQLHQVQEELESYYLRVQGADDTVKQQVQALENSKQEQCKLHGRISELEAELNFKRQEVGAEVEKQEQEYALLLLQFQQISKELEETRRTLAEERGQSKIAADMGKQSIERTQLEQRAHISDLESELGKVKNNAVEQGKENELLLLQLHQVQEELENYFLKYQELQEAQKTQSSVSTQQKFVSSNNARPTDKPGLMRGYFERRKSAIKLRQQVSLIRHSGLFDEQWYLKEYADVAQSSIDPIRHYLKFGAEEGRDPSLRFDTSFYLRTNPDITNLAMNPLVHYLSHGKSEGRKPHA